MIISKWGDLLASQLMPLKKEKDVVERLFTVCRGQTTCDFATVNSTILLGISHNAPGCYEISWPARKDELALPASWSNLKDRGAHD